MAKSYTLESTPSWNNMKTPKITERMLDLYETCKWHDCEFKLKNFEGKEESIFAHGVILASGSPVFEALCFGPMAERKPVEIPDVDPVTFRIMLKFIYTDCIEFPSVECACNVLYASKKYLIYSLAGIAISYISYHISESNCLQVYDYARFLEEDKLVKESWNYICSHLDDVLKYVSKESLSTHLVKSLVNAESLNASEIILYEICLMWAKAKCEVSNLVKTSQNLRQVLIQEDLLNKIRWLTLTLKEFQEGPQQSGILTNEEIEFVAKAIKLIDHSKSNTSGIGCEIAKLNDLKGSNKENLLDILQEGEVFSSSINNSIEMRKRIQLKKFYCHRFIEQCNSNAYTHLKNLKIQTCVIANKSVRLSAIFLNARILPAPQTDIYGKQQQQQHAIPEDYSEKLLVCISNDENILFSTLFCEKVTYGTVFKISLPNPVIFEQSKKYKIQIDLLKLTGNYLFGTRNSVSKFPSGLCVQFQELANIGENSRFVSAPYMSIISGLELCL